MISIDSHPLSRTYSSHILSRSFFITYLCYILVLILPAIILVNIDCISFIKQTHGPTIKELWLHPMFNIKLIKFHVLLAQKSFTEATLMALIQKTIGLSSVLESKAIK